MATDPKKIKSMAQKVVENRGSTSLAQLEATMDLTDKLDEVTKAIKNIPQTEIPKYPEFPEIPEFPTAMKVEIEGVSMITLKGDKGEDGIAGKPGRDGKIGIPGKNGSNGLNGKDGKDGSDGLDGRPGRDMVGLAGPDIVAMLEGLDGDFRLDVKAIKNLANFVQSVAAATTDRMGLSHAGAMETPIKDSSGILLSKDASGAWRLPSVSASGVSSVNGLTGAVALTGTTNRITISAANVFDIAATYAGQSSITTLGTVGTGTWQGTKIGLAYGGTNADLSATGGTSKVLMQTSSGAAVTVAQLAASDLSNGTTGSGSVVLATGPTISLASASTAVTQSQNDNSTKLATTAYVDLAALGQNYKEACKYATTTVLPTVVYNNGSSGVGATLTAASFGALSFDGSTPSIDDRILVKNQASTFQNGIYKVTVVGGVATLFILTRATDTNQSSEFKTGDLVFITAGSTLTTTTWAYTGSDLPTIGTDAITYVQVAGQGSFTGGNGITITGTSIAINTAITADLPSNQAFTGIKTFTPTARTTGSASYLTINAPADTGITTATESIGINHVGATRTWVDGTVATQREYYFGAPTYNKTTTAATFTNLATLVVSGSPVAGTGVTFTHPWALWVQGGNSHFGSQVGATQVSISGTGAEFNDSNNTTGGHIIEIQNTNAGTSAFSGLSLGNNQTVDGGATTHFAGIFWNSSNYSDTTFGTAFAIASQASFQNVDGPICLQSQPGGGYLNIVIGGSATTNEVARFTTTGMTVGLAGTLTGQMKFSGATSGSTILTAQAAASGTLTLPSVTDTIAVVGTAQTFTKAQRGAFVTATDGSTVTLDMSVANNQVLVLAGNRTLGVPTNIVAGQSGVLNVRQDITGSRTLAYAWCWQFIGGTAPTLSTGKLVFDQLVYMVNSYSTATVTVTIAAPAVMTWTAHGMVSGQRIQLTTTGALPTGLSTATTYWVTVIDANTFNLSTSLANAQAATFITTTGSQSGTHTATNISITLSANLAIA